MSDLLHDASVGSIISVPAHPHILIVEDDQLVINVLDAALKCKGFHVQTALCAAAAISCVNRDPSRISLLITDIVLPDIDGVRLSQEIRRSIPGLKVIFMTGYEEYFSDGALNPWPMLRKPFGVSVLYDAIDILSQENVSPSNNGEYAANMSA